MKAQPVFLSLWSGVDDFGDCSISVIHCEGFFEETYTLAGANITNVGANRKSVYKDFTNQDEKQTTLVLNSINFGMKNRYTTIFDGICKK